LTLTRGAKIINAGISELGTNFKVPLQKGEIAGMEDRKRRW